jgi:general secretion pathway protein M
MMALALPWWRDRSPREQLLLAIMAGLVIIVTLWLGVVRPLALAGDRAAARHATAIADLGEVRRMTIAIRAAEARRRAGTDTPLLERVRASASVAGLTLDMLESSNTAEVSLRITAIKPVPLLRWIASLESQDGIKTTRLASSRNADQTLAVSIILSRGGR